MTKLGHGYHIWICTWNSKDCLYRTDSSDDAVDNESLTHFIIKYLHSSYLASLDSFLYIYTYIHHATEGQLPPINHFCTVFVFDKCFFIVYFLRYFKYQCKKILWY